MLAATCSLALAALAVAVDCACLRGLEPLNKTMRRLAMNGTLNWHEADGQCDEQFPGGFQMLHRDFLHLSDEDRALCQGLEVPLKMRQPTGRPIVWDETRYLGREEEVSSEYWKDKVADVKLTDAKDRFGSLNVSTGQWRLVDQDTAFHCVICQRDWVVGFERLLVSPPRRPRPFYEAYTFRLVSTGNDSVDVDEAIHRVEERINGTELWSGNPRHVKIVKADSDPGGGNGTLLRFKSTSYVFSDDVTKALGGKFHIEARQDMDWCPATRSQGRDWEGTWSGLVQLVRLPDSQHVASRRCGWTTPPDGDRDAVWEDEILVWVNREEDCLANGIPNKRVDPGALELEYLVETSNDFRALERPIDVANLSHAIDGVLSSLLVATTITAVVSQYYVC